MNVPSTHAELARQTRVALGLTQEQLAGLLGIATKSLTRLEAQTTPWPPATQRVFRLLLECKLIDLERTLVALEDGLALSAAPTAESEAIASQALSHIRAGHEPTDQDRVRDLIEPLQRPAAWVYWASGARADIGSTKELADGGIICRPLLDGIGNRPDYISRLQPGQRILLCHNGNPVGWYRLRLSRLSSVAVLPSLPRLFKFVRTDTALGRRLARLGYRTQNGSMPTQERKWFSCLLVIPAGGPKLTPPPRGRGVRDAMTPLTLPAKSKAEVDHDEI